MLTLNTRKWSLYIVAIVFAFIVLAIALEGSWSNESIDKTTTIGNGLSSDLDRYLMRYGAYPDQLIDLVPEFIAQIAPPEVGNGEWNYVKEVEGYYLGVNGNDVDTDPVLYRTHTSNEWYMDTK